MPTNGELAHIPGPRVPRLIGHTLTVLRDAYGSQQRFIRDYGQTYKVKVLGEWRVNMCGADALEMVLLNRDGCFSSEGGWSLIARLFSGGLMLQDGDHHRQNRRIMQAAFRAQALQDYMGHMQAALEGLLQQWPQDLPFDFCKAIKELTLRVGCAVFMGLAPDSDIARKLNKAFAAEIHAAMAVIRYPIPFTAMWRGVRGRKLLSNTFRSMIPQRRKNPGTDFFSQMCTATDENGKAWGDDEIIDQFNFLMMAAHDTTATALTSLVWALGAHPQWQDTLRDEAEALGDAGPTKTEDLKKMVQTERVFKEALRLAPPVPFIPRRAIKAFDWQGLHIPAGTEISLNPGVTMMSDEFFSNPEMFDPERFAPDRAEDQAHRFCWTPFGGGAHKCIGMHFSSMQVKLFVATLLKSYRVELISEKAPVWDRMPIPKPRGGLPIILRSLEVNKGPDQTTS